MIKLFTMKQLKKAHASLLYYGKEFLYAFFICVFYSTITPKMDGMWYFLGICLGIGVALLLLGTAIDYRIRYRRKIGRQLKLERERKEQKAGQENDN